MAKRTKSLGGKRATGYCGGYAIVERKDHLAVHSIFDSRDRAKRHLKEVIPEYVARGYYMDKTLRPKDFEIISLPPCQKRRR